VILGAHESVSGGLHKSLERAVVDGCRALQVFTKNGSQWREPALAEADVLAFRAARDAAGRPPVLAHSSYLINLCAPDADLVTRSKEALVAEVLRSSALAIDFVVLHPGAHVGTGEEAGLRRVSESLDEVLDKTRGATARILIENTAGQGTTLGHRFEHIGAILEGVHDKARLGVCFDTQHAFASGYDARTEDGYASVWEAFDANVGLEMLRAFHLNDSKKPLGSRIDRHEHIGEGCVGLGLFWRLVNDPRFATIPAILETEPREGDAPFKEEVAMLTSLVGAREPVPPVKAFALELVPSSAPKRGRGK
jgi:deoxyribonuclease-4